MKIEISNKSTNGFDLDGFLKKEIHLFNKGLNEVHKERFYGELAILLNSGISLVKSLDLIKKGKTGKRLDEVVGLLRAKLLFGHSISESMESSGEFSPYELKTMEIGEKTGKLGIVTADLADFYQEKNKRKREVISALTYPAIVTTTAVIVLFFMLKYVVPMFKDIFQQNHVELPILTRMMIRASEIIDNYGVVIVISSILFGIFWKVGGRNDFFQKKKDQLALRIPFLGSYVKTIQLSRFTHTMMLLANAKIPISTALHLCEETILFFPLKKAIREIDQGIMNGEKLSDCFKKQSFFDENVVSMILVAEETNQVEYIFQKLNEQYTRKLEISGKKLASILNPLLTLLIGLIVGTILISMYLPMFRLSSVIG